MKRFCLVVAALLLGQHVTAAQKFDAAIGSVIRSGSQSGDPLMAKSAAANKVPVLIKVEGDDISYLASMGVEVRSRIGNIVSANVPYSSFGSLISEERVQYVEAERQMIGRLNVSVPATRANLVRSGAAPNFSGATGAGVIVGVIDDGLDFRHLDFRRPDGSTRLLGLWDQRESGAAGTPPTGFAYGGECTPQMLNDAIGGNAAACTQPSIGNHGSHVGGIAAGNGQQTGNGQPAYRFIGMAPSADILAANSIAGGAGGNAVVDAIAWMKARAQLLGKPLVINLSLGSYFGARDGTSNFEQALSNAGAPGVVLVAAAGNEGRDAIRASGTISQAQTQTVTFNWAATVTQAQRLEMWYPGTNQYAVKVNGPGGCTTGFHLAGTTNTYTLACGTIEINSTDVQASNDDRQILVRFTPANPVASSQGAWSIEVRGDVVAQADTPFSMICGEDGGGLLFTSNTTQVTTQILTDTASASRTIGVAAYNTNYSWTSLGGNPFTAGGAGPLGDVSDFSSRGPRRNCSNLAKCPVIAKPEITAPGSLIMSALGQDAPAPNDGTTEADGKHVAYNGTSMATPHVSGAVALMLQKNRMLTPEQVKGILFNSVQTNAFSTGLPNAAWGNGILDAQAALQNTPALGKTRYDFNADGRSDILYRNDQNGQLYQFRMDGFNIPGQALIHIESNLDWKIVGQGDYNGDGKADLLWRNEATGAVYLMLMDGFIRIAEQFIHFEPNLAWKIIGSADFDGDGKSDILYRNELNGQLYQFRMDGFNRIAEALIHIESNLDWKVVATGDYNGDGRADLLWRNDLTGAVYMMQMNGFVRVAEQFIHFEPNLAWKIIGSADFDADGKADILYRNDQTGQLYQFRMDGFNRIAEALIHAEAILDWKIVAQGDYNGDGRADLLWRNDVSGAVYMMQMNGFVRVAEQFVHFEPNLAWKILGSP